MQVRAILIAVLTVYAEPAVAQSDCELSGDALQKIYRAAPDALGNSPFALFHSPRGGLEFFVDEKAARRLEKDKDFRNALEELKIGLLPLADFEKRHPFLKTNTFSTEVYLNTELEPDGSTAAAVQFFAGSSIESTNSGTGGWAFLKPDGSAYVLTNMHVLAGIGGAKRPFVHSGGFLGRHYLWWPLYDDYNSFDLGIIRLEPKVKPGKFRDCAYDKPSYPTKIANKMTCTSTDVYFTLGAARDKNHNIDCLEGRFEGTLSYREKEFGDRIFINQLVFSKDDLPITQRGDSGSVIVHKETNEIVGLVYGEVGATRANGSRFSGTIANPLYLLHEQFNCRKTRKKDGLPICDEKLATAHPRAKVYNLPAKARMTPKAPFPVPSLVPLLGLPNALPGKEPIYPLPRYDPQELDWPHEIE